MDCKESAARRALGSSWSKVQELSRDGLARRGVEEVTQLMGGCRPREEWILEHF